MPGKPVMANGSFAASWESLLSYSPSEWPVDSTFGIFILRFRAGGLAPGGGPTSSPRRGAPGFSEAGKGRPESEGLGVQLPAESCAGAHWLRVGRAQVRFSARAWCGR